ncbi:CDP-glycerol glycerophosphotransferase family protein [Streptomyces sp. NPDC102381]|uniref:bifunctional glycosyltransferase/CDP-glycerol:glycerophosphate glycerophosphotransferase n=1 Tax=Streptomyces sp. NPDC102381 TaxID=3366164 RepID=UPI0038217D74
MSPRLSIVVPFQNVEQYLEECLQSIALQTFEDFEAILVDDGSTDGSTALASEYCRKDPRFRLIRQEAHGPGHARNTAIRAVDPDAEFLAFVDGDDVIPDYAHELLIGTLEESGSDFVSGNVRMMNSRTSWPSSLHHALLRRDRRRTHITRRHDLIYDRTVWNKVFRRSFWDEARISYPEGVLYEDVWVNLYAHYSAKSVDVVSTPVYFWRRRDGGAAPSITQRNHELDNVRDRIAAVGSVSRYLGERPDAGFAAHKRRYDEAVLKSDLMIHLNALPDADETCRAYFLEHAGAFLDAAAPGIIDSLPAADRVKWHLVRAHKLDELLEVLAFERRGGPIPVRRRLRRHLDYPYFGDRSVGVPKRAYRLGPEFTMRGSLASAQWDDGKLKLTGRAYIRNLNIHKRHHTIKALALRNTKLSRRPTVLRARTTYTPEATEYSGQNRYSYDWSGFETTIDPERLKRKGKWVEGTWDVAVGALSRGLFRYKSVIAGDSNTASHPAPFYVEKNTRVVPLFVNGSLKIRVERVRCRIIAHTLRGEHLELRGVLLADDTPATGTLRLRALTGAAQCDAEVSFTPGGRGWSTFRTRIPLAELVPQSRRGTADNVPKSWGTGANGWKSTLHIPGRKRPLYPVVARDTPTGVYPAPDLPGGIAAGREVVVHSNAQGFLVFFERIAAPVADTCFWDEAGNLTVEGDFPGYENLTERQREHLCLVVRSRAKREEQHFHVRCSGGRFRVALDPAHVETLNGAAPLASGRWDFDFRLVQPADAPPHDVAMKVHRDLIGAMPVRGMSRGRDYSVQTQWHDRFTLMAHSTMPVEGRGPYRQKLLRTRHYPESRRLPLRETVLFDSFRGTQISDSPRAIFDELTRRGTDLELLWVVRDDQVQAPPNARAVLMWSPEWYEALARSRYLVFNNHFPRWFRRRDDQVVVQTWHGTPLKKIGHDIDSLHFADHEYLERLPTEVGQWSMLISPNRFSTPILRRAFGFEGEMLETGYPRNDVHHGPDRAERAAEVRRRLGLPEGKRVVLYAPTWRDHLYYAPGKYKFDYRIDPDEARRQLGDDHVLLVRRHPNVVDPVPGAGDGFVWDVTAYSDMADLMLITDVMVTDYSSLMFDFANTGRPMLFFTYDLDHYRDTLRGFYFDFEENAPGPLLSTSQELIESIRDVDRLHRRHALQYRRFQQQFCDLEDGHAARRVVDHLLGEAAMNHQEPVRPHHIAPQAADRSLAA